MASIDEFLNGMLEMNGSDLHIMVGQAPRIRVDGDLMPLELEQLGPEEAETLLSEICPPEAWERFLETEDLDFAYELPGVARFRCNYFRDYCGIGGVLRVIPSKVSTLEDLKLPEILKRFCAMREGMILFTGPTGSGKSTTLAALIDYINRTSHRKIVTVEEPIEFVHQNQKSVIIHREVGQHTDSFETALRSAMRSDPDIVLLGEMRDQGTIRLALDCAAMGIVVFGTLHTSNAPKTIDRIIDVFPADEQPQIRMTLAECLRGVVSQLLCKKIDESGRVAVHEILFRTEALANTIREGHTSSIRNIIEAGKGVGMVSMEDALETALKNDLISAREAYDKATNKERFAEYLKLEEDADVEGTRRGWIIPLADDEL